MTSSPSSTRLLSIAFVLLSLAVVLGAFGAHALADRLSAHYLEVFQTANRYHFIHSIGIIVSIVVLDRYVDGTGRKTAVRLFIAGLIFFSGALYLLSLKELLGIPQLSILGAVAPIGGLSFVSAWAYVAYILCRHGC